MRAYDGPDRTPDQVATITGSDGAGGGEGIIFIEELDGVSIAPGTGIWDRVSVVTVEPGVHVLRIGYKRGNESAVELLAIRIATVAGGRYEIHGGSPSQTFGDFMKKAFTGRGHWMAWVIDAHTGELVAGQKPE